MKKLIYLLAFLSLNAHAFDNDLTITLDNITLTELVKIAYGDLKKSDYVIDDDLLTNKKRFNVQLEKLNKAKTKEFVNALLVREGYEIENLNNVTTIYKQSPDKLKKPFLYTPLYRSTQYLTETLRTVFNQGQFTGQNKVFNPQQDNTQVKDSGTSAYSMNAKPSDVLLFKGSQDEIKMLVDLLPSVDTPVPELMITTYIFEVSKSTSDLQSLNIVANLLSDKLGFQTTGNLLNNFISLKTFGISAVFNALSSDNRFKVLSSPSLRVRDQQEANFTVGSEVPVLGAIVTNQNGQSNQSIEYKQSGIILNIQPKIKVNQYELKVDQQLSNFVTTQTGVNNTPTLIKRSLSTIVNAQDDDVIILGGLEENKQTQTSSGFSLLPKFFRNNQKEDAQNNILLVMHVKRI